MNVGNLHNVQASVSAKLTEHERAMYSYVRLITLKSLPFGRLSPIYLAAIASKKEIENCLVFMIAIGSAIGLQYGITIGMPKKSVCQLS